jgi:cobalt/nickel transport system ATP-binding protein
MPPLIAVTNLRYRYADGSRALNGIDFQLDAGEAVALLGANGSGKTTFVLHLIGLLRGEGEVSVCGLPVKRRNLPAIRRKLGVVFQDPDEQLFMPTVLDDVCFGPLNLGLPEDEAVRVARAALKKVGMSEAVEKAPYHLSAGEKRRVAVAGVIAMNPEILVLDEPTTYLDPPGRRDLLTLLEELPQAKLLVTHDTSFALALCQRAVFFEDGRITDHGSVEEVVDRRGWGAIQPEGLSASG